MEWLPYKMPQNYVYKNLSNASPFLSATRIWSQGLSTNEENNLYGSMLQVTTQTGIPNTKFTYYNPLYENTSSPINLPVYVDNLIRFGNICVNDIDSSIGNLTGSISGTFVPATWLINPVEDGSGFSDYSCQELPLQSQVGRSLPSIKFDILAEFTSHSSLPPYLYGKRFFLSCPKQNIIYFDQVDALDPYHIQYANPSQYIDTLNTQPLFRLVNTLEGYENLCATI